MNSLLRKVALFTVMAFASVACGDDSVEIGAGTGDDAPGTGAGAGESLDGDWVLVTGVIDGLSLATDDEYRITMTIDGSEIGGRAACNNYGGSVSIDGRAFSLTDVFQNEMGCETDVMTLERVYLQGLFRVTDAVRFGDTASLSGAGIDFTFEIVAPIPTADLVGPTWVLDTIITGDAASSTQSGAEPATLTLGADGTFTGSTGCRTVAGDYVISGDTVQFTSFGADGECSPELTSQDNSVISVLEGGVTVTIDGDRLTITASGGEGLSYRTEG